MSIAESVPALSAPPRDRPATSGSDAPSPVRRRRRVVAILPRGEAIRNFAQTGALDAVVAGADLTVLSVVPGPDVVAELAERFGDVRPLETSVERYPVRILRELLDMAHGRTLWSAAAQERWRLRDAEARRPLAWLKRRGRKLLALGFATRRGVRRLERLERRVSRLLCPSPRYERLYGEIRPSLVFNGSHVHGHNAIQAVQAAQWLGIPTAAFIFSWDNLTSQGRVMPAYDHYLVWNEEIKGQLLAIYPGVRPEQVHVTGTPQFDAHFQPDAHRDRREYCAQVGADPNRPIVLYSTGMAEHMPGEPRIVEQIADMLGEMGDLGRPQLLVRVYPKDLTGRFDELRARRTDILFPAARWIEAWLTPTAEDARLYTNMLRHSDVGINVASTVSLELCMFDKPVINVGYDPPGADRVRVPYARYYEYDHYRPLVVERAVRLAHSAEEMRGLLRAALADPASDREHRRRFLHRMFGDTLDGRSGERVARVLLDLAAGAARA